MIGIESSDVAELPAKLLPRRTPLVQLKMPSGQSVWLKDETKQHSGAFKFRGSFNFLSVEPVPERCVVAASTGNHAAGLSAAAQLFGYQARIFLPSSTPKGKQERIRGLGGKITLIDGDYEAALSAATDYRANTNATLVPSYDHDLVIEGNRNIFREIVEELNVPLTHLVVPVGGGGLLSGALRELNPEQTQITAVEYDAVRRVQKIVDGKCTKIAAPKATLPPSTEGIGIRTIGQIPRNLIATAKNLKLLEVTAAEMADACRMIYAQCGIRAELAACASVAALMRLDVSGDDTVVCIISGGNIDGDVFSKIVHQI